MYTEDQLLPISALQHLIFCERQCALIHVERLWAENRWTVEGRHLHDKAHTATARNVAGVRLARGLRLHSYSLGLYVQADVVEVASDGTTTPIEYKRGKPKTNDIDRVQLCAQAICLEEMRGVTIETGQLFYGQRKRRTEVPFDTYLRELTKQKALRLHQMIANRETPTAVREPKCDQCSLLQLCLPDALRFKTGVSAFVSRSLAAHLTSDAPETDDFDFVATSESLRE